MLLIVNAGATGGQNMFDVAIDGERVTGKQKSEERETRKRERTEERGGRGESKRELTW